MTECIITIKGSGSACWAWCSEHGRLAGDNGVIVGGPQKLRRAVQTHLDEQAQEAHTET